MRTRWSAYAGVSVALAGGVIVKALAQRPNFYSAAVYLSQSSANLMILTNMVFVASCTLLLGLQKLLYGPLRPIEIEQLYEKAWFAVTETCLAMTIFRGEIGAWFLVMFFALLAGKVWAWIGEGRVEVLEQQPPQNPRLFHTRLALSLGLSVIFNLSMLEYVVKEVMDMARPDMMVMFGFEFAVLSIVSLSSAARYAINLVEIAIIRKQKALRINQIRNERMEAATVQAEQTLRQNAANPPESNNTTNPDIATAERNLTAATTALDSILAAGQQPIDEVDLEVEGWEGKGRWVFYLDLATDFFKLVVYLSFFFILLIFYGLPIHILRDVFMTCRSFIKRIADFVRYRTATRDMNDRYPDANEQEIGREDVCIICREEMRVYVPAEEGRQPNPVAERMRPKKLPCGHVLHFSCLRSWLERQQICPTCRTSVVPTAQSRNGQTGVAGAQDANAQHGNVGGDNAAAGRVYQFGPLRIGVGAARGNVLENLQQQLGDGPAPAPVQGDANGVQQYGFGIRWDGMRRRERTNGHRSVQDTLNSAERQIQRELNALGGSLAELQILRNMESELARVRALRQAGGQTQTSVQSNSTSSQNQISTATMTPAIGMQHQTLQAGSDGLPPGMVLPEGWTMMPLQPMPNVLPQGTARAPGPAGNGMSNMFMAMQGVAPQPGIPFPHMQFPGQPVPMHGHGHFHGAAPIPQPNGIPATFQAPIDLHDVARNMADIVANRANGTSRPASRTTTTQERDRSAQSTTTSVSTEPHLNGDNPNPPSSAHTQLQTTPQPDTHPSSATTSSLPTWGSAPASNGEAMPSVSEQDGNAEVINDGTQTSSDGGSRSTMLVGGEPSSTSRKHKPTVEDLVEDPD